MRIYCDRLFRYTQARKAEEGRRITRQNALKPRMKWNDENSGGKLIRLCDHRDSPFHGHVLIRRSGPRDVCWADADADTDARRPCALE